MAEGKALRTTMRRQLEALKRQNENVREQNRRVTEERRHRETIEAINKSNAKRDLWGNRLD